MEPARGSGISAGLGGPVGDLPRSFGVTSLLTSSTSQIPPTSASGVRPTWEELRREARRLEGELDVKLSSYAKLCGMLGQKSYREGSSSPLVSSPDSVLRSPDSSCRSVEREIETLLQALEAVNERMGSGAFSSAPPPPPSAVGTSQPSSGPGSGPGLEGAGTGAGAEGGTASLAQKLSRHRDILQGFQQEFRRARGNLTSLREHAELLSSASAHGEEGKMKSFSSSASGQLTERKAIQGNIAQIDIVISQATATKEALAAQRSLLSGWQGRLKELQGRFPVLRSILGAIRKKRSRDTIILGAVITFCTSFLIIYWLMK